MQTSPSVQKSGSVVPTLKKKRLQAASTLEATCGLDRHEDVSNPMSFHVNSKHGTNIASCIARLPYLAIEGEKMRKILVFFGLLMVVGLWANPVQPAVIQQIWFDDAGDLILQLGRGASWLEGIEANIQCGDYSTILTIPEGDYPMDFNLSDLMPEMIVSREAGQLSIDFMTGLPDEQVSWGTSSDCDVSSPVGNQSIYQFAQLIPDEWEPFSYNTWAKSPNPDMVQDYHCSVGCDLTLGVRNLQYEPLANIPVYYQNYDYPIGHTDAFGSFYAELPARNTRIRVYHPNNPGNPAFDLSFVAEPYQMNSHTVVLDYSSVDDPALAVPAAQLLLKPSVLRPSESMVVEYGKDLPRPLTMELYDIKGRLLHSYQYIGAQTWNPPSLGSGMYFLRMKDADKTLDTKKFIMLK